MVETAQFASSDAGSPDGRVPLGSAAGGDPAPGSVSRPARYLAWIARAAVRLAALILLFAACAKLAALVGGSLEALELAAALVEGCVGAWLLVQPESEPALAAGGLVAAVVAGVAVTLSADGVPLSGCRCFGDLAIVEDDAKHLGVNAFLLLAIGIGWMFRGTRASTRSARGAAEPPPRSSQGPAASDQVGRASAVEDAPPV